MDSAIRVFPTSSPGLFPQKMGGAGTGPAGPAFSRPHPFFEGKALGTRLVFSEQLQPVSIISCHLVYRLANP